MSSYDAARNNPEGSVEKKEQNGGPGVEPSGVNGANPSTAGPGKTEVQSNTSENKEGHLNPSAPEDSNVTPGTTSEK